MRPNKNNDLIDHQHTLTVYKYKNTILLQRLINKKEI